jgi:hypothetical protein
VPIREEQLERSMRAAAPHVSTVGVLDRVAEKRVRRRTVRRIEAGALAALLIVALSTTVVLVGDDNHAARVAAPGGRVITGAGAVTPQAGAARAPVPIALDPDQGYVRGPLVVSGSTLSLAAYDHHGGSFSFPPSRIVRLDNRTFREQGRTDLRAEILSIADTDGARWLVTRNPEPPNGLPDAFLKRIGADGAVDSKLLPFGSDPVGDVVVGAGLVWIPVRDGVLRYDAATTQFVSKTLLPAADQRVVAIVNGSVLVTNGNQVAAFQGPDLSHPVFLYGDGGGEVIGLTGVGTTLWTLIRASSRTGAVLVGVPPGQKIDLPDPFVPASLASLDGRVWVEGTVNGAPAVVLVDRDSIRATVVLDDGRDASFAWVSDDTVLAVSSGTLLRIDLEK